MRADTKALEIEVGVNRSGSGSKEEEQDDDEEEEMPEEFKNLSPEEQQKSIIARSFQMMGLGTFLVVVFSDPMVDVLNGIGTRTVSQ